MSEDNTRDWLLPTLAGMGVATLRRFRRRSNETWRVVLGRFLAHAGTCVIAGYVVGGLLNHFGMPSLVAPVCALAGLYGTMLADWLEEFGINYLNTYIKNRIKDDDKT